MGQTSGPAPGGAPPPPTGPSGSEGERLRASWLRHRLEARGLEVEVQGFVAWPGRSADAAVHLFAFAVALVVGAFRPAFGLLLALLVLASLVFQPRVGALLRHLLPRRRSYNLLVRRGEGARRIVAFAFVDAPRRNQRFVAPLVALGQVVVGVAGLALLLRWSGLDAPWLVTVGSAAAGLLTTLALVCLGLEASGVEDADGDALKRLVALAEGPEPEGVELLLVACGAGHPWLDGLEALDAQSRLDAAAWWPLGRREAATAWLVERERRVVQPSRALALLEAEYDAADDPDERGAGGEPVRDGDGPGG